MKIRKLITIIFFTAFLSTLLLNTVIASDISKYFKAVNVNEEITQMYYPGFTYEKEHTKFLKQY